MCQRQTNLPAKTAKTTNLFGEMFVKDEKYANESVSARIGIIKSEPMKWEDD